MRNIKPPITSMGAAAAVGAGLAAALLSLMPALKSPAGLAIDLGAIPPMTVLAWAMAFIAPLPIMVAAFGFGSVSGLIAAVVGALAVGIVDMRPEALTALHLDNVATGGIETIVFAVVFGLPSWLLVRLTLLSPGSLRGEGRVRVRPDESKLGLVIAGAAAFAAVSTILDVGIAIHAHGGFDSFMATSAKQIEPFIAERRPLPKGVDAHSIATAFVYTAMALMAAAEVVVLAVNLWLAARVAQMSGLLSIPWPDIPRSLRVPRPVAMVLAVALGLSVAGGPVGLVGLIVSGALGMAFALHGLAVVHALTRGKSFRLPFLIIVYLTLVIFTPGSFAFYALLGLLDLVFAFRDRQKPIVKKIT